MITYVPVTDPELAREYYEAGILLWCSSFDDAQVELADSSWSLDYHDDLEQAVVEGTSKFCIRLEE